MRAIQVREFGGPDVMAVEEVPDPAAGPGQVVLRTAAADVIYLDTLLRSGWGGEHFPLEPPYVPGGGGVGRVLATGEGVDPDWRGRRALARAATGYAERIVADVDDCVAVPDAVTDADAAAALHDGVTALNLSTTAELGAGRSVLVAAATGGAGTWLVQLARAAGAHVIAAARGERKLALARELGAHRAVDYSAEGWTERVREAAGGSGVDLAFDGAGGRLGREAFEAVRPGGEFVTYGSAGGEFADIDEQRAELRNISATNALASGSPGQAVVRDLLARALALVEQGRIKPVIAASYPLDRAREAHRSLTERTTIGRPVLEIG
ncbi:zinc-binding dehydrogenase [Salinifilum aidingensis]